MKPSLTSRFSVAGVLLATLVFLPPRRRNISCPPSSARPGPTACTTRLSRSSRRTAGATRPGCIVARRSFGTPMISSASGVSRKPPLSTTPAAIVRPPGATWLPRQLTPSHGEICVRGARLSRCRVDRAGAEEHQAGLGVGSPCGDVGGLAVARERRPRCDPEADQQGTGAYASRDGRGDGAVTISGARTERQTVE